MEILHQFCCIYEYCWSLTKQHHFAISRLQGVSNEFLKYMRICCGLALRTLYDWLTKTRPTFFFPAFDNFVMYLLRIVIGSLRCLRLLSLARFYDWLYDTQLKTVLLK